MKTALLIISMFLLMSTVGAYAATTAETGEISIGSPSSEPLVIGFSINGGVIDAVKVTWTPVAEGIYKIEAMTGSGYGTITTPLASTTSRTDVVPIPEINAEDLESINVAILEL